MAPRKVKEGPQAVELAKTTLHEVLSVIDAKYVPPIGTQVHHNLQQHNLPVEAMLMHNIAATNDKITAANAFFR